MYLAVLLPPSTNFIRCGRPAIFLRTTAVREKPSPKLWTGAKLGAVCAALPENPPRLNTPRIKVGDEKTPRLKLLAGFVTVITGITIAAITVAIKRNQAEADLWLQPLKLILDLMKGFTDIIAAVFQMMVTMKKYEKEKTVKEEKEEEEKVK